MQKYVKAEGLHVASVAEVDAGLRGALVRAVLQRNHILTCFELLVAEVANVLLGLLWTDTGLVEIVSLK